MERVRARCLKCLREFSITPNQVQQGHGCAPCRKRAAGKLRRTPQSVWDARGDLVGIDWLEPVSRALQPSLAQCRACGRQWQATPAKIQQGSGCRVCNLGRSRISQAAWDELAYAIGQEWLEQVKGTKSRARIRCKACGYEWLSRADSVQRGQRCRACAGNAPITEEQWKQRASASGLEWLAPVVGAKGKVLARCLTCKHEWSVSPAVVRKGHGCPSCAGTMVQSQEVWDARAAAVGIEWLEPVGGTKSKTGAKCLKCDHEWGARPDGVMGGKACPACSQHGISPVLPGRVYLITYQDDRMKVGVMNQHTNRLDQHVRRGWEIVDVWDVPDGETAVAIERATLAWWKSHGARKVKANDVPHRDGATETVWIGKIGPRDTTDEINTLTSTITTSTEAISSRPSTR
jgi:hypothetical protein